MDLHKLLQEKGIEAIKQFDNPAEKLEQLQSSLNKIDYSGINADSVFAASEDIDVEGKQLKLVYVNLMVQDIKDTEFFYSYIIQKPITVDSKVIPLKFGVTPYNEDLFAQIQSGDNHVVLDSREPLICQTERYQTAWMEKWSKIPQLNKKVTMMVPMKHEFKLGEKITCLAVWNPQHQELHYLRNATEEEIITKKLNFKQNVKKQTFSETQLQEIKQNLIKYLQSANCSKQYSHLLLYSLISPTSLFLDGPNLAEIVSELYPRVLNLKIKVPFKNSLFPYKNDEGTLVSTPMQLSTEKTFVILDFSELSQENVTKIDQAEIDNLKALKVFVEEGQAVYRWEFGESLFPHNHSGIIVKASSIISPHYKIKLSENNPINSQMKKGEKIFCESETVTTMEQKTEQIITITEEMKHQFRVYIEKCKNFNPVLSEDSRAKIQALLKEDLEKSKESGKKIKIPEILQLAKLNAMTMGRNNILVEDYEQAKFVLNQVI